MATTGVRPIKIVEIVNPFQPDARLGEVLLAPRPGEFLADCIKRAGLNSDDYALRLNDEYIEPGEEAFHAVKPGDKVVCCRAAAGEMGKVLGMIAIMAVTTALTGGFGDIAEAMLWTAMGISTPAMAAVAAAAISIGGSMLINAFMGGPGGGSGLQAGATYDPTGPKTLARPGTPIPKGYGTMGWGGNIISSYVDMDGKDEYLNILVSFGFGPATNISDVLLNGKPIAAFPDLAYHFRYGSNNQTPIPGFDTIENVYPQQIDLLAANGPTIYSGTGTNVSGLQIVVKFPGGLMRTDSSGNPKEVSFAYKVEVSPHGKNQWTTPIFPRTTQDVYTVDANGFRHYPYWVVMPTDRFAGSGIVYSTDTNEGAHYPGEPWNQSQSVKVYNVDNTNSTYNQQFQGEWQPTSNIALDLMSVTDWWGGWRIVSNMTDQSFYDVVNVYGLAIGQWDARITKWGAGPHNESIPSGDGYMTDPHYTADGWLWDVAEIQFTDLAYPNSILLGIRALATSQISGADITVLATITHDIGADTVLPAALVGFEHDNPAIVAYDMIMNPLYGMAASNGSIGVDIPAFVNWANFCDELVPNSQGGTQRRFVFAGVFDQGGSNAWQCLQQVALMSRAQILQDGNSYTVWCDAPTDITQIFTDANIKRGSFAESFIALDSRANQIDVEFADAVRNWRTDLPVSVMTEEAINGPLQPKITRTKLSPGCTNRDQAWQWGYFNLLSTQTLMRTAKWTAAIEAVSCRRGSVVGVQQRQWCWGGRVQRGSTKTNLVIDRTDLPAFEGAGWTVGVQHPVVNVGTAVISSVTDAGNGTFLVTFTGNLPAGRILHIANGAGAEAAVLQVSQAGGKNSNSLTMGTVQGIFATGQTVTLYDYHRIELQAVTGVNGLNISVAGFSQAPAPDAPWFYGQTAGAAPYKTFRVTSIKQSGDFDMEISGIEYNTEIYTDPTPNYGAVVSFPTVKAAVSNLVLAEKVPGALGVLHPFRKTSTQSAIYVFWDNGPNTRTVDIWGQVDGGAWNLLAAGAPKTGYTFPATDGDVWSIIVVGRDQFGVPSSYNSAPMKTIAVQGIGLAPGAPSNVKGDVQANTLTLSWDAPSGTPAAETYEIRYNSDPANSNWNDGTQVVSKMLTTDYMISNPGNGLYMVKSMSAALVESLTAATFSIVGNSSSLNSIASVLPGQALLVNVVSVTYDATSGKCSCELECPAQSLLRPDGTTYSVPDSTLTWTKLLTPSTTYYIYTSMLLSDGILHSAAGDPPELPDTSPSPSHALLAAKDGYYAGPIITVTTPSTSGTGGTSSGGGTGVCPDAEELVESKRGIIRAGDVVEGDELKGWCFETSQTVFRRVLMVVHAEAYSWYRVQDYRMSPLDPVRIGDEWVPPYKVGVQDNGLGIRARIAIQADGYDQRNYYLVGRGEPLLIHNVMMPPCTVQG